jgi:ATP-dependent protease Clp ATPase subunit
VIPQFKKLVGFHGADLVTVREIAKIALERGTGARGLRLVVEEVIEGVLFDVEAGVRVRDQRHDGHARGSREAEHESGEGTIDLFL